MSFILRHNIKILEISHLYDKDYKDYLIGKSNMGQASIEHLILNVRYSQLMSDVLHLILNYCNFLPMLKKVDLILVREKYDVSYIVKLLKIYLFLG
jgi:riboflavin transporter FmnP